MALQHGKCADCERRLGPSDPKARLEQAKQPWRDAAYEFDVEHFHPKNAVEVWPSKRIAEAPRPVVQDRELHDRWRARVAIDFFDLGHGSLEFERAQCITTLLIALRLMERSQPDELEYSTAENIVTADTADHAPHSSYARAYHALYGANTLRAEVVARDASKLVSREPG